MDYLNLLPTDLQAKSLSKDEIVLPYKEVLRALDTLLEAKKAFLGWAKYSDGKVGHSNYQGTTSIEKKKINLGTNILNIVMMLLKKQFRKIMKTGKKEEKNMNYIFALPLQTNNTSINL